jgi:hypothetical protein
MDQTRALTTQRGKHTQRVSVHQGLPVFVKPGTEGRIDEKLKGVGAGDDELIESSQGTILQIVVYNSMRTVHLTNSGGADRCCR